MQLVLVMLTLPVLGSMELPPFSRPVLVVFAESKPMPRPPVVQPPRGSEAAPAPIPIQAPEGFHSDKPQSGSPSPPVPGSFDVPGGVGAGPIPTGARWTLQDVAPPQPQGPIRPGGHIRPPERTGYVAPVYPPIAIQARREGTVVLEATIDETGVVRHVSVLRSVPLLDRAAIDAVRQWRYSPTRLNGVPVAIIMKVRVTFTLK